MFASRITLRRFVRLLRSANAVAGAVENHRTPKADDLRALGIDPEQFCTIRS